MEVLRDWIDLNVAEANVAFINQWHKLPEVLTVELEQKPPLFAG